MQKLSGIILLGIALGCVSTQSTLLNPSVQLAPVCPDGVQVFTAADKVGKPFSEIALLDSKGDDDFTSETGMINSQRKKAAELGANGVVLGSVVDASTGAKVASALIGTSANRKGKATAIYIPADTARVRQACRGKMLK